MDPGPLSSSTTLHRLPRARGDGPWCARRTRLSGPTAPRTRGWTLSRSAASLPGHDCPAHAGMDPSKTLPRSSRRRLPRARGDGPRPIWRRRDGDRTAPRTRGWTRCSGQADRKALDCPAHAGMDPAQSPRTPAVWRLPRARGDGPHVNGARDGTGLTAPRTRGWTRDQAGRPQEERDCPAHAGMDPATYRVVVKPKRLPRARGDGPCHARGSGRYSRTAPRTRGWTRLGVKLNFRPEDCPAHAGMDPDLELTDHVPSGLPRARGDGPCLESLGLVCHWTAPRTRGWTSRKAPGRCLGHDCPAHAGMDPKSSRFIPSIP